MCVATLKYSCVFIYDAAHINVLLSHGYGAKRCGLQMMRTSSLEPANISPEVLNTRPSETLNVSMVGRDSLQESESETLGLNIGLSMSSNSSHDANNDTHLERYGRPLVLLDEEAFYLLSRGVIIVRTSEEKEITVSDLWIVCCFNSKRFPIKYKVYEHFKNQGFVVRTGASFGVDYTLYRTLPSHCHSEICVLVLDGTGSDSDVAVTGTQMASNPGRVDWNQLGAITRVMPVSPDIADNIINTDLPAHTHTHSDTCTYSDMRTDTNTSTCMDTELPAHTVTDTHENDSVAALNRGTAECLTALCVRMMVTEVRRGVSTAGDPLLTVRDRQMKYRSCALKKVSSGPRLVPKKRKDRRDPREVREKKVSKKHSPFHSLNTDISGPGSVPVPDNVITSPSIAEIDTCTETTETDYTKNE